MVGGADSAKWYLRVGLVAIARDENELDELSRLANRASPYASISTWATGEKMSSRNDRRYTSSGVRLDVYRGEDGDVASALDKLSPLFSDDEILQLLSSLTCELSITIKLYGEDTPAISVPSVTLKMLADIGAQVDVDLYVWGSPERPM